ncbi:MAG TPA: response regulator transcription factor [Vicinamibacterales bacterium]|jgi:DNA-binding NarL/FixJ family response regulator|nr:response regulator transcription factor [Vicinamibacterales bacterium]
MRVVLVGSPDDRHQLRQHGAALEIVGEFDSLAAANASGLDFDAVVTASAQFSESHGRDDLRPDDADMDLVEPLTAREVQVLELLAEGLPNKGIAARLGISDQTVKFHVSSIAGKLGAANRTDVVRRAVRRGLITL